MRQKQSLLPLLLLIGVFLASPIIAIFIHLLNQDKPITTTQNGIFVPVPFHLEHTETTANLSHHNWSLVFIEPEICQVDCLEKKHLLNNLHIALGKDQNRVKVLAIKAIHSSTNSTLYAEKNIIILNPQGLAIMYYPPNYNPSGILHDLRKLLKNSHV